MRQVGFEHDPALVVGVDARALAQRVLQLLDQVAHVVRGAQRPAGYIARHEHDPCARHIDDVAGHLAQPRRRPPAIVLGRQLGQDPRHPVAWHSAVDPVGSTGSPPTGMPVLGSVLHQPPPCSGGKTRRGAVQRRLGTDRDPRPADCTAEVHRSESEPSALRTLCPLLPPASCHKTVGTTRRRDA